MENFQGFSALEVNHIDGNKSNNSLSNLEYTTRTENVRHAFRLGLNEGRKGEAHGSSVLTDKQVLEIREKFVPFRYTHKKLAFEFGVSKSTIAKIISRDLWSHLD